jgi:hypothetical protein
MEILYNYAFFTRLRSKHPSTVSYRYISGEQDNITEPSQATLATDHAETRVSSLKSRASTHLSKRPSLSSMISSMSNSMHERTVLIQNALSKDHNADTQKLADDMINIKSSITSLSASVESIHAVLAQLLEKANKDSTNK